MIKNKKGWLRILEAFISILILISAVIIISSKQVVNEDFSDEIIETQIKLLNIISRNDTIRDWVINEDNQKVTDAIAIILPRNLEFLIKICKIGEACGSDETPTNKEVYTREVLITTTLNSYDPKKLRLFVWSR